jgi:glycosyltransferase involved in cell wall biosynthesis
MNICYLYNGHPLLLGNGGIGARMRLLSQLLFESGHNVTFVGSNKGYYKKQIFIDKGVVIIALPHIHIPKIHRHFNRWLLAKYIEKLHNSTPFDLIEMPEYLGWYLPENISGVKVIRFSSSNGKQKYGGCSHWWIPYLEKHIDRADFFCSVSKDIAAAATETHNYLVGREITTIYSGVDTTIFKPQQVKDNKYIELLYFGSLNRNKGVFELAMAWNKLYKKNPKIKLVFCGQDRMDSVHKIPVSKLLKQALDKNSLDRVEFRVIENRQKLARLIQISTIVVLPSYNEGFSNALLEAMACGKPVVYSKVGSSEEIIQDGINGILCNIRDSEDLFKKILWLIENPEQRKKIGNLAFETIRSQFTQNIFLKNNIEFYKDCISRKKSKLSC